jgi:lipopolysaccharide/colanic/teichoic acid biosynthesis glycosyltransferase
MGQDCQGFRAVKFRTMTDVESVARRADDPLEHDRITPLGYFLRKSRIDELPQILNVLVGQMSLIGPRPDFFDHALVYLDVVPGYRERHSMKPGISGLAQTELGYVEGLAATERKAAVDLYYIRNASLKLDTWVFWRTLCVVMSRGGK